MHVKDLVFNDPDAPFRASDTARVKADERAVRSRVVGTGVVPWPDILEELVRRGYDDVLTLEYEYRWHPQDLPDPAIGFKDSAARAPQDARQVVPASTSARRAAHRRGGRRQHRRASRSSRPSSRGTTWSCGRWSPAGRPAAPDAALGLPPAYPTVEALLEAEELDAVFVLTPRSEHAHATRLPAAGVDVFCEKPLATSASDEAGASPSSPTSTAAS